MHCKSCGVHLGEDLALEGNYHHAPEGPLCGKCMGDMPDWHIFPVNDLRPHQLTRRCWCEPILEWPCAACAGSGEMEQGIDCPVCGGSGNQSKANPLAGALVIHDSLDGRD